MKRTIDYVKTGKNLEQILLRKNLSINDLSEKMECSPQTIKNWISAKSRISTKSLLVLMWALQMKGEDIIVLTSE